MASFPRGGQAKGTNSVHFVTYDMDLATWRALGTREGHEVLGEF